MASPESIIMQFRKRGYRFTTWPRSTDKEAMVEDYRSRLELGKVKIFNTCTNTIDEHESWMFKRNTRGEQLSGDDQYEDKNNHSLDVILGVNATKPKFASAMKIVDENRYNRKPPPKRRFRVME